jgi:hypothetical protein
MTAVDSRSAWCQGHKSGRKRESVRAICTNAKRECEPEGTTTGIDSSQQR